MALGGARPGAGRKTNASKLLEAGFVASWFTTDFQETTWKSFLASEDEKIRLEATKYLTDRLYGKAPQSMTLKGDEDEPLIVKHIGKQ